MLLRYWSIDFRPSRAYLITGTYLLTDGFHVFYGMILPAAVLCNLTEGDFDIMEHVDNAWPVFLKSIAAADKREEGDNNTLSVLKKQ